MTYAEVLAVNSLWKTTKTGEEGRRHVHETTLQRAVKEAVRKAGIVKRVGCHSTTMIYTHVLNKGGHGVRSPLNKI